MRYSEFVSDPNFSGKLFLCVGDEGFFHSRIKDSFIKKFPDLKIQNVEADDEPVDFYSRIESETLFSDPKLVFINNLDGELKDKKLFEQYVTASETSKYVVFGDDLKVSAPHVKIECGKIKDNAKDVSSYVKQMLSDAGVNFTVNDIAVFHFLYRNDLLTIFNEIQKIKLLNNKGQKILLDFNDVVNVLSPSEHQDIFKFSNNFMGRKLKGALNSLPADDFLPHIGNIFSTAEKILIAKKSKLSDELIIKNYKINSYYFNQSIKPILNLWSEAELKNLMGEMNLIRLKLKETKLPVRLLLKNCILKYCTR